MEDNKFFKTWTSLEESYCFLHMQPWMAGVCVDRKSLSYLQGTSESSSICSMYVCVWNVTENH